MTSFFFKNKNCRGRRANLCLGRPSENKENRRISMKRKSIKSPAKAESSVFFYCLSPVPVLFDDRLRLPPTPTVVGRRRQLLPRAVAVNCRGPQPSPVATPECLAGIFLVSLPEHSLCSKRILWACRIFRINVNKYSTVSP